MTKTKAFFLATFLFFIGTILPAQITTDKLLDTEAVIKTVYHFPPPMDAPSFPFKVVTVDENTPEWAKMIYKANPNIAEARELYFAWKAKNTAIKNGHTRNFRKLSGYLAQNDYVNEAGFIDIPTNEEIKAESAEILKDRAKFKRQQKQSSARNSANNTNWQLLGPTFKKTTSGNLIDRHINVYSITQSLSNKDILYCATESGGTVFKTTNHGDTWFSVSDNLITSMGARNIEVAPSNPDIVYLCTQNDIFKTTTGNDNWVSVYNASGSSNRTLIIHPTNPNTVLTGGDKGILKTIDGGASWTNPLPDKTIYDLRYKPGDTLMIYALVKNAATNLTEFYKSIDAGETWSIRTTGWPAGVSNSTHGGQMTTSDGNDNYIYAFIGATWTAKANNRNIKIVKSLDYGESWTTVVDYDNDFGINSGQGYYDWDIEMSDTNPDVVYGGTQGRWVTKDGFQTINQDIGSLGHPDVQETLFNGTDLWVVNDGGIILFENENFQNYTAKSIGLNSISYWSFDQGWNKDVSSATHYHNGTSAMSENYEDFVGINFGGAEPSFSLVAQPSGDKMVSKGYGAVNGYTMPDAQDGTYTRFNYNLTPNTHSYSGNNVGVHPAAYETHFLGVENILHKSEDFGVTWNSIYEFPFSSEKIWDIEFTRANLNVIFVTTIYGSGGNLYRSLDGGQSFTEIALPSQFSNNPSILNVSVSNEDANVFYVMADKSGIKIAKTTDGGATWIDLDTPTLSPYDGHKIMQVDGTDGGIYLLTRRAVFYRNNTLADWVPLVDGMPANTRYQYIRPFYRDKELRIATSRGVYEAELYDTPQLSNILLQPTAQKTTTDCARDTFYFDDFSVVEHAGATWSWSFPDASYVSATNVSNPKVVFGQGGQFDVTMSITKNGQTYTKTVEKMITVGNGCSQVDEIAGTALQVHSATSDRAITESFDVTTNTFSFSAWIKPQGNLQAFSGIFSNGVWCAHCNDQTLGLGINYWGDRLWYRWPNSTSGWASATNLYPQVDEWSYVAFVMSPNKVTVYLNEQKWESTIDHEPAPIGQLYMGFGNYTKYFNGLIDEATFWNRSLTEQEIKELMHLTKDPTTDADLLAYYQFNEAEGIIFDKAGTVSARLLGGASRVVSSAPIGGGFSHTASESSGNIAFGTSDFEANFTNQSGIEVVASKINQLPYNLNGLAAGEEASAEEYWAIHRFGSGDFMANLTFKTSQNLTTADANIPSQFALYRRGNRSEEDWEFVTTAISLDAATDKITFEAEVQEWGQYFIAKSTQPILRANSSLVLANTAVGAISPEENYQFTATNLAADAIITAPIGFQISTTSGANFTNSLSLSPTNGVIQTTIFVRFMPTEARLYKESITHSSAGANDRLVMVESTGFELDRFPGSAIDFDGSNDYIYFPVTQLDVTDKLTLEFWVDYQGSMNSNTSLLEALDADNNRVINLHLPWSNSRIYFDGGNVGGSYDRIDRSVTQEEVSGWNHWAFVKDATEGTMKIYRNGELWHEGSGKNRPFAAITQLYLGRRRGGNYNNSKLDELRIWNTARSQTEIREYIHLTANGSESGLVTYFQFNEASGNAIDLIGNLSGGLRNGAARVVATEPIGGGYSNTQTEDNGVIPFTNTDLEANFISQNGAEIVTSKLELAPSDMAGIGENETAADNQYWVVNRYGTGAFEANITLTLAEDLSTAEAAAPTTVKLYGRNKTSDGTWMLITTATTVDAVNDKVTFDGITTFEQYLITRSPYPKIAINQTALAFGNVLVNTTSELTYTVSATDLSNDLIITSPIGFDISLTSGTNFIGNPNTLTISPTSGTIDETTIYVRFNPTNISYQSGIIEHNSNGTTNKQIAIDGIGIQPEIDIRQAANIIENNSTINFGSHRIGQDSSIIFTIKNEDLGDLNLTGTPVIEVVGANAVDFSLNTSSTDTTLATGVSTTFEISFKPTTAGVKNANISIANNDVDENPFIINLTGIGEAAPAITVSSLTDFSNQLVGTASTIQSYMVAGTALADAVIITSTSGFEISLNENANFSNKLTLTPSEGSLSSTTIYVRFVPQGVANYNGAINHVSENAVTKIISIKGSSSKLAESVPGNALTFDGNNDRIALGTPAELQITGNLTIQMWLRPTDFNKRRNPIHKAYGGEFSVTQNTNGTIQFYYGTNGGNGNPYQNNVKSNTSLILNEWNHLSIVRDFTNDKVQIYINGVLDIEVAAEFSAATAGNNTVYIGDGYTNNFAGSLDEVRVWDRALTKKEVQENMHLTLVGDEPNLVLYYQFNEQNFASVYNIKGDLHSGTGGATRAVSTAPVGGGFSDTKTENSGSISFTDTDVDINFTAQNNAEVVVSKINLAPNAIPTNVTTVFDKQYWAIHRYGTGSFIGNVTFKVTEDLTDFHQNNPSQILLYGRAANSDDTWQLVSTANSVDATTDKATFNNIAAFDQYLLASLKTDFTADKTGTCLNSSIQFTDASDGTPTTWAWTFEGGTPATSSLQNPVITYNSSGIFGVTLVIDNGLATQSTIAKSDFITVSNELVPSISATAMTICLGESVDLTASGGTTYQWTTHPTLNQTTGAMVTATPTMTTSYTVTATDGAGCMGTKMIEITVNSLPTASLSGTTSLCQGADNPTITFTGANGTAPYTFTYQINDGENQTITTTSGNTITLDQNTETAGTFAYKLINVADANGCSQNQNSTATITVSPLPMASIAGTTTICKNEIAPTITFTGTNGTAPYTFTYQINGGANQTITTTSGNEVTVSQTTGTAGIFAYSLVQVEDANGCTQGINGTATIIINELPTATTSGTIDVYQNATNPNITFTGANGVAPYTFIYQINDGMEQTITTTSGSTVKVAQPTMDLGTFTYTLIRVTDANNCTQTQSGSAIINVNALPTAGISGTTTICQNETSPEILFTSDQGVAPYTFTYKVNDGPNQTVTTISGGSVTVSQPTNIAGTFVYNLISIADANGGSQAQSGMATVTVNPLPTATISGTTSLCKDAPMTLVTFTGANGTAPYTFTYTVNGGSAQTLTTSTGNTATLEQATGSAGVFTYTLVSASDATECSQNQTGTATITINELPTATVSGTTSVYNNDAAPEITFTGTNGTAPYTFTYTINDGPNQTATTTTGNTINVAQPTSSVGDFIYNLVSVADANNCMQAQSGTATITINALPTAGISGTTTVCLNATSPEIIFTSNEGTAPYIFTYTINGGPNQMVTTTTGNSVAVAQSTTTSGIFTYELVSIEDANNASQAQSGSAVVTVGSLPTANPNGTTMVCQNDENPLVQFTGYNGTAPYTFTFKIDDDAEKTVTTTVGDFIEIEQDASEAGIFTYTLLSVVDDNGCMQNQTGSAVITINTLPRAAINTTTPTAFRNDPEPEVVLTGADGKAPYIFVYTLNDGVDQMITSNAEGIATISQPTTTEGTFVYALKSVTDANNCEQIQSGMSEISIEAPPVPIAEIEGTITTCQNTTDPTVTFTGNLGSAPYTFRYKINDGATQTISTTTGNQVSVSPPTTTSGTFTYTLLSVADTNYPAQNQSGSAIIIVNPLPTATISGTTTTCKDETAPTITFTGANGIAPYTFTYQINDGVNQTITTTSGNTITLDQDTETVGTFDYKLISVADTNSCTQNQNGTATIIVNELPTAAISGTATVCKNTTAPTITFTGMNGTAPYTFRYKINGGAQQNIMTTSGNGITISQTATTAGIFAYELVQVQDANGCIQTIEEIATITINELPTANISGTIDVYQNTTAPSITFTGTNGVAPFTFTYQVNGGMEQNVSTTSGNTVEVTQPTTNLGTFTYTLISVVDANNCTQAQSDSAVITINALPTAGINGTTTICQNATSPEILFTSDQGVAPYTFTYKVNNGPNQTVTTTSGSSAVVAQATNIAGIFVYELISVADANNGSQAQSGTATITVNPLPTATISGTTTLCKDEPNTLITFTGATGTAPYTFTYTVNGGSAQTLTSATGNSITLEQPTGNTGTFTYALVSVSDAAACSQDQSGTAIITINELPTAAISGTTEVYHNAPAPEITFTGMTGVAPYTFIYTINDGPNQMRTTTTGNTIKVAQPTSSVGDFIYKLVNITDTNNCSQPQNVTATITVNALPSGDISGTTTVCLDETDPEVSFTSSAGIAPFTFTYTINDGPDQTVTTTSGNSVAVAQSTTNSGIFTYKLVRIEDANNASQPQSGTAIITVKSLPTATISGATMVCQNSENPLIKFTGTNGVAPYTFTYKINNGIERTVTTTTGNFIEVAQETDEVGTFTYTLVSVADGNGCIQNQTGTAIVMVNDLPRAVINTATTSVFRNDPEPAITLTGADGKAPYTFVYTLNDGANQLITSNAEGIAMIVHPTDIEGNFVYALQSVTDANNCTDLQSGTSEITVIAPPLPTAEISGAATICQNATAPTIIFTGDSGSTPYTFTYKINNGETQTISTTAGTQVSVSQPTTTSGTFTYTLLSVADANYPAQNEHGMVTVTVNSLPSATINGTITTCKDETAPTITFTGTNGTAPYTFTYQLNDGDNQTITTTSGNTITLDQNTETVGTFAYKLISIADANGCAQNQTGTATITINELPTASISGTIDVYQNSANPNITFTGINGIAPYTFTYKINGGANQTITTTSGNIVNIIQSTANLGTFTYTLVSIADANNCVQIQDGSATINVNALPTAGISGTTTVCLNTIAPEITFTSNTGTAPYTFTYTINNGPNQTVTTTSGNSITVAHPTTNSGVFTYDLLSISDANNMPQGQSGSAVITVQAAPNVSVYPGNTSFCLGQSITPKAQGATSYTWSPTEDLSATTGTTVLITPMQTTDYQVIGTGENGCKDTVNFTILIDEDCCPEGNLVEYENTNNLPILTHTSDYIVAGNLSGIGDVNIENGQTVTFKSNNYIQLQSGFYAKVGASFTAFIEGCSNPATLAEIDATERIFPITDLAIPSLNQVLDIKVYPNPFTTKFTLNYSLPATSQASIYLVDMLGRQQQVLMSKQIKNAGKYQLTYENKGLKSGIYFLILQVDQAIIQRKIVLSTTD